MNFTEKLAKAVEWAERNTVLVLNADYETIGNDIKDTYKSVGAAIFAYNKSVLDAECDDIAAIIMDLTSYMQYGLSGAVALKSTLDYAAKKSTLAFINTESAVTANETDTFLRAYLEPVDSEDVSETKRMPIKEGTFCCDAVTVASSVSTDVLYTLTDKTKTFKKGIFVSIPDGFYPDKDFSVKCPADGICLSEASIEQRFSNLESHQSRPNP